MMSCDIFCKVGENFGEVSTAYRLAKCLYDASKFEKVRLWVDNLSRFALIENEVDDSLNSQEIHGIRLIKWVVDKEEDIEIEIGNVVIEIFGCGLSESFLQRLESKNEKTKWINFEYLSSENWIPNFHLQGSKHPRYKLTPIYFFPGFTSSTGGLIREKDLSDRRDEFDKQRPVENYPVAVNKRAKQFRINYFSYEIENLRSWLSIWGEQESPIHMAVNPTYLESFTKALGATQLKIGDRFQRGALSGIVESFCSQEEFDRRLWGADLNFVRGEDSFVRALWAGNIFIWQPYPTKDRKHINKLNSFLERYLAPFPDHEKNIMREFFLLWNGESKSSRALALLWKSFMRHKGSIAETAKNQSVEFSKNYGNLIDKLIDAVA